MQIKSISLSRFKQFKNKEIGLQHFPLTIVAGPNNAGKSSILQGMAIWEFCRNAISREKGAVALTDEAPSKIQGLGLNDDEFSPINLPSLKHLWSNLKTSKIDEADGYTLKVGMKWIENSLEKCLAFRLALVNDRLFIKVSDTNIKRGDILPSVAYLPPFAGILSKEQRQPIAIRRRRIGEGLAGAVLRNQLLDFKQENERKRAHLKGDKSKISSKDLRNLRKDDPFEIIRSTMQRVFGVDIIIDDFSEDYHSYINVRVSKGELKESKVGREIFKNYVNFSPRDLMVEGSGLLQWLSVYTIALDPKVDVILLDEPDAHLHPALQDELFRKLEEICAYRGAIAFVATHSSEIIKKTEPERILKVDKSDVVYLKEEHQKVTLLSGLGSTYSPKIDRIKIKKKIIFHEGQMDAEIIKIFADKLGRHENFQSWVFWQSAAENKERKQLFIGLSDEINGLECLSLRDRDDVALGMVAEDLTDRGISSQNGFKPLRWRRKNIEGYLCLPSAISHALECTLDEVTEAFTAEGLVINNEAYESSCCPDAILNTDFKKVFKIIEARLNKGRIDYKKVARAVPNNLIPEDIKKFISYL